MKPFFSYYGSKYRLCQQGFYPAPKSGNVVIEPFAGSATYSVYHEPEVAVLIDKYDEIASIWQYLINSTHNDIMQLPDFIDNIEELNQLPDGASNLISFWIHKVSSHPSRALSTWYKQYKNDKTCRVWGFAVKKRIASQVEKIKGWTVLKDNYDTDISGIVTCSQNQTWFIDPPYSSTAGRKYKHNKINYHHLQWWIKQNKCSQIIACENQDLTYAWADFNQSAPSRNANNRVQQELAWVQ